MLFVGEKAETGVMDEVVAAVVIGEHRRVPLLPVEEVGAALLRRIREGRGDEDWIFR